MHGEAYESGVQTSIGQLYTSLAGSRGPPQFSRPARAMKPPAAASSRGRPRLPLSSIAAGLITCAVVFSLYTAFRPTSTSAPGLSRRIVISGEGEVSRGGVSRAPPCPICPKCPVASPAKPAKPAAPLAPARVVLSSSAQLNLQNSRRYHVVTTCQGFSNHWQARIHYYWSVCMGRCMAELLLQLAGWQLRTGVLALEHVSDVTL